MTIYVWIVILSSFLIYFCLSPLWFNKVYMLLLLKLFPVQIIFWSVKYLINWLINGFSWNEMPTSRHCLDLHFCQPHHPLQKWKQRILTPSKPWYQLPIRMATTLANRGLRLGLLFIYFHCNDVIAGILPLHHLPVLINSCNYEWMWLYAYSSLCMRALHDVTKVVLLTGWPQT